MDAKLAALRREVDREWRARQRARVVAPLAVRRSWPRDVAGFLGSVAVLGALPFYALIRGAVYLHERQGLPAYVALLGGALLTIVVVTAYGAWLSRRITGRHRVGTVLRWFALPVVGFYAAYALIYVSAAHVKSPGVQSTYAALHPLLRVALATVILGDPQIVITDLGRVPEDYDRMGLPRNDSSLHYRQRDGYLHAADLRTAGHGAVRNRLVQLYFWSMGFDTLRHVGTADHLHVSLPTAGAGGYASSR